ncbi:DUF6895 family protein [Streptomyces sp. NPDC086091]|uniref:DUF6895 family protein n=1 Tax=Streptomyces sp. NPDC086091 TaxID=3365751 RepID=UPI0037FA99C5
MADRAARRVALDAAGWLRAHRDAFRLGGDALAPDGRVDATWKPLGELAQVCATVTRRTAPADPLHTWARDLLAFAWRETDEGALFVRMQRQEPFSTYPLEVYAAFASAGLRHPGYERAVAALARCRGWQLTEQDPTRRLGVLAAQRHTGVRHTEAGNRALRRTWLGGLPEPWTFERASGYAMTHVVFHLTDWGRATGNGEDAGSVPAGLTAYLTDWLPPWLDTCLEAGMWDLSVELLAVAGLLPGAEAAPYAQAWERVRAAQLPDGALPEDRPRADGPVPGFAHCYHSSLLAVFAAALTLARPGRDPRPAHDARSAHDAHPPNDVLGVLG